MGLDAIANSAPSAETVRTEIQHWLSKVWNPEIPRKQWLAAVVDARWAVVSWAESAGGRNWPVELSDVVREEFNRVGAPGAAQDRTNLFARTVLACGTEDIRRRLLRPLLCGEISICLLYSEPGSGSDLASVRTRADRDGDWWIVSGQKVWTSGAANADYGMLIARTNWDAPKHKGSTFFLLPMHQTGVEVRPIRQITGESHFNEVFMTAARVPDSNRLGVLGGGWLVLQSAIGYERSVMGEGARGPKVPSSGERHSSVDADTQTATPDYSAGSDIDLISIAQRMGKGDDPVTRQALAQVYILRSVNRWNTQRARRSAGNEASSSLVSIGKLAMSRLLHFSASVQSHILGAEALLDGKAHPLGDAATFMSLNAFFTSIGGGTDQIQQNIIGERVLGLTRDPEVDRDIPFRLVTPLVSARVTS